MAKRLTDTNKWNDDWYLSLNNDYRIIWQWLLDNCNHAGILKRGIKVLNFCCNTNITESELFSVFEGRLYAYETFYFLPKFLKFQYETGLNSKKPVIVSVVNELNKNNLIHIVNELYGNDYIMISEPLNNDSPIIKDKDKDKDKKKDKRKSKDKWEPDFENLPNEYRESLKTWWDYKIQIKSTYVPAGWDALVKTATRDFTPSEFKHAVERSMANGWKGVFSDKSDKPNLTLTSKTLPKADDYGTSHF